MIIRKYDNLYIIKINNKKLKDFDYYNQNKIKELFQNILIKIKEKYQINGLLDINVYTNNNYGMIIEIEELATYLDEIDIHIHFHLDTPFLQETNNIEEQSELYFYKDKYYTLYNSLLDSSIIYKTDKILSEGIKVI